MLNNRKAMVVLSGGMDSATLLYHLIDDGYECQAITMKYGQRHRKEIISACQVAVAAGIRTEVVDLTSIGATLKGTSLTDPDVPVPHGHYAEESMKATVVPNRNMILLSVAAGYAISQECGVLAYGAHAGDHAIYPDCRPEFVVQMIKAFCVCHYEPLQLEVPFLEWDKGDICSHGLALEVPYRLTWTCYEGGVKACGKCGACRERLEAFEKCGEEDPISYA